MIKYDYIFLDFDGPVLDGRNRHYHCYMDILQKYGGKPVSLESYWEMKRNRVDRRELLKISCFDGSYEDYMNEWMERIEKKEYLQWDLLQPNTVEAIRKLKEQTEQLYLVTMRQSKENLIWQLRQLQIELFFEKVICGTPTCRGAKYEVLKDIVFQKALLIGDTEIDMETAKKCGCEFKGVLNGLRNKQVFQEKQVYTDLYHLAQSL